MSIRGSLVRRFGMATQLLNDDGTASMATMVMSSHFAFRRDIACFARSLGGAFDVAALRHEWAQFRAALHGHHTVEDTSMFPDLRARHPEIGGAIDELDGHHRAIDPLLERGDALFADLPNKLDEARALIDELQRHLAHHLDTEERVAIPHLRDAKQFPPMPEEVLAMYADGFAWSTAGLAPSVFTQICAMLPAGLVAKLPTARDAFDERCRRVWGHVHAGTAVTSAP